MLIESEIVGVAFVELQQIPRAVTVEPPQAVTFPPPVAVTASMEETVVVVNVGAESCDKVVNVTTLP